MYDSEAGYEALANAIIAQAVKDYEAALKNYMKRGYRGINDYGIKDLERFFRSEYYRMLTELDGEYLIKRVRRKVGITEVEIESIYRRPDIGK